MSKRLVDWKIKGVIVFSLVIGNCFVNLGCKKSEIMEKEKLALEKLASSNWQKKSEGLNDVIKLFGGERQITKRTADGLVKALKDELQKREQFFLQGEMAGRTKEQIGREFDNLFPRSAYGDYLLFLGSWVVKTREDAALPFIFQMLVETDYVMNVAWPTFFGEPALGFLVDKALHGSAMERVMAFRVLSVWVFPGESGDFDMSEVPPLKDPQKEELLPIFLKGVKDPNQEVVYLATSALEAYVDKPLVKSQLTELSKPQVREDIREEAKRILNNASE